MAVILYFKENVFKSPHEGRIIGNEVKNPEPGGRGKQEGEKGKDVGLIGDSSVAEQEMEAGRKEGCVSTHGWPMLGA